MSDSNLFSCGFEVISYFPTLLYNLRYTLIYFVTYTALVQTKYCTKKHTLFLVTISAGIPVGVKKIFFCKSALDLCFCSTFGMCMCMCCLHFHHIALLGEIFNSKKKICIFGLLKRGKHDSVYLGLVTVSSLTAGHNTPTTLVKKQRNIRGSIGYQFILIHTYTYCNMYLCKSASCDSVFLKFVFLYSCYWHFCIFKNCISDGIEMEAWI